MGLQVKTESTGFYVEETNGNRLPVLGGRRLEYDEVRKYLIDRYVEECQANGVAPDFGSLPN
jgi:hypothetical protein